MTLQEIFYVLAIAFFVSTWIVIFVVGVIAFVVYQRMKMLQARIHGATTSIPFVTLLFPLVGRVFRWWRHR